MDNVSKLNLDTLQEVLKINEINNFVSESEIKAKLYGVYFKNFSKYHQRGRMYDQVISRNVFVGDDLCVLLNDVMNGKIYLEKKELSALLNVFNKRGVYRNDGYSSLYEFITISLDNLDRFNEFKRTVNEYGLKLSKDFYSNIVVEPNDLSGYKEFDEEADKPMLSLELFFDDVFESEIQLNPRSVVMYKHLGDDNLKLENKRRFNQLLSWIYFPFVKIGGPYYRSYAIYRNIYILL